MKRSPFYIQRQRYPNEHQKDKGQACGALNVLSPVKFNNLSKIFDIILLKPKSAWRELSSLLGYGCSMFSTALGIIGGFFLKFMFSIRYHTKISKKGGDPLEAVKQYYSL
jgi:hypothetical protein